MAFWDPDVHLELDEGEQVLFMCRRHWILLFRKGIIPVLICIGALLMVLFRALGGAFFTYDPGLTGVIDPIGIALAIITVVLLFFWVRGADLQAAKAKKKPPVDLSWALRIGLGVLLVVILARYQGWRLFTFNIANAEPFGVIDTILVVIAILAFFYFLYVLIDWRDDTLILTNTRVVYDNEEFLIRHIQQQILLADIQQVLLRRDTYPSVIFGYGALTIQSFSVQRLYFNFATNSEEMERRIKDELSRIRKQLEPNLLRRLIEEQVFESRPKPKPVQQEVYVHTSGENRTGLIRWLFPPNPQIDNKTGQILWRPAPIYILLQILPPLSIFLVTTIAAIILAQMNPVLLGWLGLAWFVVSLICAGWIFWLREELVEDVYIINRREIIDVDKRPFGPVNRRSAPLANIQNISFDIGFFESLLGFGTVKIQTGGTGEFTFNHVPDPRGVQSTINDYLTDFRKRADERNLQNSLDVLKEYHSLQRQQGELMDRADIDAAIDRKAQAAVDAFAAERMPIHVAAQVRAEVRRVFRITNRQRIRRLLLRQRNRELDSGPTP